MARAKIIRVRVKPARGMFHLILFPMMTEFVIIAVEKGTSPHTAPKARARASLVIIKVRVKGTANGTARA